MRRGKKDNFEQRRSYSDSLAGAPDAEAAAEPTHNASWLAFREQAPNDGLPWADGACRRATSLGEGRRSGLSCGKLKPLGGGRHFPRPNAARRACKGVSQRADCPGGGFLDARQQ